MGQNWVKHGPKGCPCLWVPGHVGHVGHVGHRASECVQNWYWGYWIFSYESNGSLACQWVLEVCRHCEIPHCGPVENTELQVSFVRFEICFAGFIFGSPLTISSDIYYISVEYIGFWAQDDVFKV